MNGRMKNRDRIHLRDHVVSADIGAFQSEKGQPQRLRFNLTVELHEQTGRTDDLVDRVLSYDVLVQAVDTALADQRYDLVETLAEKIAAEVLANPRAANIEVGVEKLDRGPGALGVTIHRSASAEQASQNLPPVCVMLWTVPGSLPESALVIIPDAPRLPLPTGGNLRRVELLALDQAAWALAGDLGLEVVDSRTEMEDAIRAARPVIWAPARLVGDIETLDTDPVALTAWLADRLDAALISVALPEGATLPEFPADCRAEIRRAEVP